MEYKDMNMYTYNGHSYIYIYFFIYLSIYLLIIHMELSNFGSLPARLHVYNAPLLHKYVYNIHLIIRSSHIF